MLKSLDIKLPLITRIVLGLYNFLLSYGIYSALFIIIVFILFVILRKKSKRFCYNIDNLFVTAPVVGKYIQVYLCSSICSMGSMLLIGGRSVPEMMIFSESSSTNLRYAKIFEEIHKETIQGISFSNSIKKYENYFPVILKDMSALGERTGSLGIMLGHCAKIFEDEINSMLKKFSSLVEPILMVFMGLVVGSVALSIILPVYEITNHLSK